MAIPSETKQWLDIAATTIENYRPQFYDQVTDAIPLFKMLRDRAAVKLDGGNDIVETVMYRQNDTVQSYEGYDPLPLTPQDAFTVAKYEWRNIAGSWVFNQDEIDRNRGKAQMKNLIDGREKQLALSFASKLNVMLYKDGTGNNSKDIQGMAAIISDTATNTLGIIPRSSNAWWRNVSWTYDTNGSVYGARQGGTLNTQSIRLFMSGVGTADNYDTTFLYALDYVFDEVTFGNSGPHLGNCDAALYQRLKHSLYTYKRFDMADTMRADPGFRHVNFNGIPVVMDRDIPATTVGTSTTVSRMYFYNLDFLNFYIHASQNFRTTEIYPLLPQQNAFAGLMFLKAQLGTTKSNAQAVLHSVFA